METTHVGFFAVPCEHVSTLGDLYARWCEAVDRRLGEQELRYNELYRTAHAVAVRWAQRDGASTWTALGELLGYLGPKCWPNKEKRALSPEELTTLAGVIAKLERRAGGPAELARRMIRGNPLVDVAVMTSVYEAFREVLMFAAEHELGMTWAVLQDDAEERQAERRRQEEEFRRRAAELPELPEEPEPTESPLAAYRERELRRRLEREIARTDEPETLWLSIVPEEQVPALRALIEEAMELLWIKAQREDGERDPAVVAQSQQLMGQALALLGEHARERMALRKGGEQTVSTHLFARMHRACGQPVIERTGVYSSAQTAALWQAVQAWEKQLGRVDAVVAALITSTQISPSMGKRAYRAHKRLLAAAARGGCGLVRMLVTPA